MEPFGLQAPESIAKQYGGNKQNIARAAQMGLIDPTAAVLAGMFIDRMRAASAQEQTTSNTVAQDVFTLPAPMQVPQGMPPQGMTPSMEAPAPNDVSQAPAGLDSVPIPDEMYGMAAGGLVAFAEGGKAEEDYTLEQAAQDYRKIIPQLDRTELDAAKAELAAPTAEQIKAQERQDMWGALAQMGFNMAASDSPFFLQAVGQAGAKVLPELQKQKEARREQRRADARERRAMTFEDYKMKYEESKGAADYWQQQMRVLEGRKDRASQEKLEYAKMQNQRAIEEMSNAAAMARAKLQAASAREVADIGANAARMEAIEARREANRRAVADSAMRATQNALAQDMTYTKLIREDPARANDIFERLYTQNIGRIMRTVQDETYKAPLAAPAAAPRVDLIYKDGKVVPASGR